MASDILVIIGAGGHGKVVGDSVALVRYGQVMYFDGNPNLKNRSLMGYDIVNSLSELSGNNQTFHIAIGDNSVRFEWLEKLNKESKPLKTIKHPHSVLSSHATIKSGVFLAALSIVGPDAAIGEASIINHHAVIDHDCIVGRACHIAPSATLGGGVTVGDRVFIGANATILPGISIGNDVIVGAGCVVTKNIESNKTVVGIPARAHKKMEEHIE